MRLKKTTIGAAVVVAAAVVVGAGWLAATRLNGWLSYREAMAAAEKGDYAAAELHMTRAAELARSDHYRHWVHYLRGLRLYRERKDSEAVRELASVEKVFGHDPSFQTWYRSARVNEAWEARDYVAYLDRAEDLHALNPDDPQAVMTMAAGNAYRYAQTGEERYRAASMQHLARLETMPHELGDRVARIRRCLETRVIVHD